MKVFQYDIINGQLCNKELKLVWDIVIDCKKVIIIGTSRRRMYDELIDCYRDVDAFYIRYGNNEYGVIEYTLEEFVSFCRPAVVCRPSSQDDCDPEQIFECAFEAIFE